MLPTKLVSSFEGIMKCKFCGNEFTPERITARFCSAKCRVYSWRNNNFSVTDDSVTEEDNIDKLREEAFKR